MKKLFKLFTLVLTVFLITGCAVKVEYGIQIDKNKNVKIGVISAFDDALIDKSMGLKEEKKYTDSERWEFLESGIAGEPAGNFEGFEKEKYEKDGYKGYKYTKDLGKINELISNKDEIATLDNLGKNSKIFTKNGSTYTLNLRSSEKQEDQIKNYIEMVDFDLKLKITLPNKAKSSNATNVDGNTYTWDLAKIQDIKLSFNFNKDNNIILMAGFTCAVVGIGISVYALIKKRKNNK